MKDFLMIFRNSSTPESRSPEQMQNTMKQWQEWMGGIAAQNKLVDAGNRLAADNSCVVKPGNVVTNGPYVEMKEAVGGYTMVRAGSAEEAAELAQSCPILKVGGSVEIREVIPMENN